jgi:uroporphyrinogen-III synthase
MADLVAITRPADAAAPLAARLEARGLRTLIAPAIRRVAPASWEPLDRGVAELLRGVHAGVLFTSPAAVDGFFARLRGRLPAGLVIGAVGRGTAAALRTRGLVASVVPDEGNGVSLAEDLIDQFGDRLRSMRFLQPRAAEGREELSSILGAAGAPVDVVDAYRTLLAGPAELLPLRAAAGRGELGAVVYASPSAVRAVVEAIGLPEVPSVAIGGTTAIALQAAGARRIVVTARPEDDALEDAVVEALGG